MNSPHNPEDPSNDENSLPKYQDWPVTNSDTRPVRRGGVGANPAITVLRIVLWLLPTIIVPVVVFSGNFLAMQLNLYIFNSLLGCVLSLTAAASIGYFDQRIALQQKGLELARGNNKIIGRVIIFVLCQIVIIPIIWVTLLYGYCAVTDNM